MKLLDGKEVSTKVKDELKLEVDKLREKGIIPTLAVILCGDDAASKVYVNNKSKATEYIGAEFKEYILDADIEEQELIDLIEKLNNDSNINGILIQSPLPKKFDEEKIFSLVNYKKDVDGFTPNSVGNLFIGRPIFKPCTPSGVIKMLEYYNIDITGKHAVIIGRSNIVGKPLISLLLEKNATVTICHSKSNNIKEITKTADIVISATGRMNMVTEDMIKEDAIVVDVGINRNSEGKLCGDVDFENVSKKCSYITPVPGGVGPMTIAMLMNNLVKATKLQNNID